MKRKIKVFFRTYFSYTQKEQKGILSLFFVIVFLLFASLVYSWFEPKATQNLHISYLQELEEEITKEEKSTVWKNYPKQKRHWEQNKSKPAFKQFKKNPTVTKPTIVEINTADSLDWVALPGIGPTLASRIIAYRNKLGGFLETAQLCEVYGFKEDLLYDLKDKLVMENTDHVKMNLNQVDYSTLSKHPYFKFTLSKAIINYRKQHGNFKSMEELKNIKLVNDSIYQKITKYLEIE
jgi:competence protein ComEA